MVEDEVRQRRAKVRGRKERFLAILALPPILLLGLALRWYQLDYAELNYDQGWSLNRAHDFVRDGVFPLHGSVSSLVVSQGPTELYLLAIPLSLSSDPRIAIGFIGLLQMFAVVGTYFFARHYFGQIVGLASAALYTINPWAVLASRKIWPDNVMPPLALVYFAGVFAAAAGGSWRWFAIACAAWTATFLANPSAVLHAPLLVVAFALRWRRLGWRAIFWGVLLSLPVAAPYLYYDYQQGFSDLRHMFGTYGGATARLDLAGLQLMVALGSSALLAELGSTSLLLDYLAAGLMFAGLVVCLVRLWTGLRQRDRRVDGGWVPYLLLQLWFVLPVVLTVRHSFDLIPSYYKAAWPVQFVLIGVALAAGAQVLTRPWPRLSAARLAAGGASAVLLLALGGGQLTHSWTAVVAQAGPGEGVPYGIPLLYNEQAATHLRELYTQSGEPPTYAYCSLNQWEGLRYLTRTAVPLQKVEPPGQLVLPRDLSRGALMVVASDDAAAALPTFGALANSEDLVQQARALGFREQRERAVYDAGGRVLFRFLGLPSEESARMIASFADVPLHPRLENGLRLAGYRHHSGPRARLTLLWEMPADPESQPWIDYVLSLHSVDRGGKTLTQKDWPLFQHRLLRRGSEYLVSSHELDLPTRQGLVWLNLSVFERYSRQPVDWRNAAGTTAGSSVKLGPLRAKAPPLPEPRARFSATFGQVLHLAGYDVQPSAPRPGGVLDVHLHWRALSATTADYVVSVQVLDGSGKLIAQHDSGPVGGDFPTSAWEIGGTVLDEHQVALPASLEPGTYRIQVVVYAPETQQRLQVGDADSVTLVRLFVE